jgi:hypothetical protein
MIAPEIAAIEDRARGMGLPMAPVLRRADVSPSTWTRLRTNRTRANVRTLERVDQALDAIKAEREKA